jgi:hypothetical protein
MVLLKLPQDLVALNVLDGWNIAGDHPLIGLRGLGRIVRSGARRFWSKGREDLVRRAEVDVVEVEGPKHA